jgi:hypothetical protein
MIAEIRIIVKLAPKRESVFGMDVTDGVLL